MDYSGIHKPSLSSADLKTIYGAQGIDVLGDSGIIDGMIRKVQGMLAGDVPHVIAKVCHRVSPDRWSCMFVLT